MDPSASAAQPVPPAAAPQSTGVLFVRLLLAEPDFQALVRKLVSQGADALHIGGTFARVLELAAVAYVDQEIAKVLGA